MIEETLLSFRSVLGWYRIAVSERVENRHGIKHERVDARNKKEKRKKKKTDQAKENQINPISIIPTGAHTMKDTDTDTETPSVTVRDIADEFFPTSTGAPCDPIKEMTIPWRSHPKRFNIGLVSSLIPSHEKDTSK